MFRYLEERLKKDLIVLLGVYIRTLPYSLAKHAKGPVDFDADLSIYEELINTNCVEICRATAVSVGGYSALYRVMPMDGVDEFKTIYFLGRAIEKHLKTGGHIKLAQAHMFSVIGLLDEKLKSKGVVKPHLTAALTELVRLAQFDKELGATGCYLIYKCSSTAPKHMIGAAL